MPESWSRLPPTMSCDEVTVARPSDRPAGFYRRLLATVLDLWIVALLYAGLVAVGTLGAFLGARTAGARYLSLDLVSALWAPFVLLWIALSWLYIAFFVRYGGQTPGKMLLRIRVVSAEGDDPSWSQAVIRPIGYLLSWLPLGLGFLLAALPGKRALHDRLTGTRVIMAVRRARDTALVFAAGAGLLCSVFAPIRASAVLVDRVLAIANGHLITLSDLVAYQTVEALAPTQPSDAIQALVDRRLLLDEADRFAIPSPSASAIASRVDAVTARLGGPAALQNALARLGWEAEDLRAWVADDLRVAEFLDERIYFFVLIPPEDIDAYYESHRDEFAAMLPEEARDVISRRLIKERGDVKREQFVTRLREKATIRYNPIE